MKLVEKLNSFLPADIAIHSIFPVPADAHARFSAVSRTYEYRISTKKDPFKKEFAWYYTGKLDVAKMDKGAVSLHKFNDFSCFSRSHTQTKTNDCKIIETRWKETEGTLIFTISADRFLRNMVRAIVGTLMEMGKGKLDEKDLKKIILSKKRSNAGRSVPACGLFLTKVEYPPEILKNM
jgi:tRNA pseudouridine38-40 synthase